MVISDLQEFFYTSTSTREVNKDAAEEGGRTSCLYILGKNILGQDNSSKCQQHDRVLKQ